MPIRSIEEQTAYVRALEKEGKQKNAARKKALTRWGTLAAALALVVLGTITVPRIAGIGKINEPTPMTSEIFDGPMTSEARIDEEEPTFEATEKEPTSEMTDHGEQDESLDKSQKNNDAAAECTSEKNIRNSYGKVLRVEDGRLLIGLNDKKMKDVYGDQIWLLTGDAGYYSVGQVVTFTFCRVISGDTPGKPPQIVANTVYME